MAKKKKFKHFMPGWWHRKQERKATAAFVRSRDGDLCWYCAKPMRFGPPFNMGKAATVEHVLPTSKGGTWSRDNLRLCHVGCNRQLADKEPEQKERMRLTATLPPQPEALS